MKLFKIISWIQYHFFYVFLLIATVITIFLSIYAQNTEFQSNVIKEFPQDDPTIAMENYISEQFEGVDSVVIVLRIDDSINNNPIKDILSKQVISAIYDLDGLLRVENIVKNTQNIGMIFKIAGIYPLSNNLIKTVLDNTKSFSSAFYTKDRKSMVILVSTNYLESQQEITNFVNLLEEKIKRSNFPYGVKIGITGSSILKNELLTYMTNDFYFTIGIAGILILIFLIFVEKKIKNALIIFLPLLIGLIWFSGLITLFNLKLSISTVATGAMILGLGVEYTIFIYQIFTQTIKNHKHTSIKNRIKKALEESVESTGKSIFGSALTTIAAFLSLNFSGIPIMSNLGTISAIGIFCLLIISVFIYPCFLILLEYIKEFKNNLTKIS